MRRFAPAVLLLFVSCATATAPAPAAAPAAPATPLCNPGHTLVNATLYVQSSAEYRANALQTYAAARRALDEALADPSRVGAVEEANEDPAQPPAVIVDVDETVLDNTGFEGRVMRKGVTYD